MAPTPASHANAAPILRNRARRRTGFEVGAAVERFSDSSSSVGISKIAILDHGQPSQDGWNGSLT
jgi:hypothetical protein